MTYFQKCMFVGGGLAVLWLHSLSAAANSAEEDLRDMKVAHGFAVKLVASEPEIRQPLSISFDERGRMWVIQYLQYPTPAGSSLSKWINICARLTTTFPSPRHAAQKALTASLFAKTLTATAAWINSKILSAD